jgi:phosphoenolpyruvate carboxykinase (ATP)
LEITRTVIPRVLDGTIEKMPFRRGPVFGLDVPEVLPGVPAEVLHPRLRASDSMEYDSRANDLARKFISNFEQFHVVSPEIIAAAPQVA